MMNCLPEQDKLFISLAGLFVSFHYVCPLMKPLAFSLWMVFLVTAFFWAPSCANIIPPSGGPRDSIPPVLIRATPADSTLNFRSDRIVFEFDEYIDLQDVPSNVLFTPTFERVPEIAVKGRTITVRFRDSLESNTTYTLSFGNAIRDINESNILRDFNYSFSTGAFLDTLEITGRVVIAQTGGIDTTLTIILHRDLDDSAVVNRRPPYVTRLDGNGNFRFGNLPPGSFAVYALGNAGISRRYQNKDQLFAFLDTAVVSGQDSAVTLYAYRESAGSVPATSLTTPATSVPGARERLSFNTNLSSGQQDLLSDLKINFPVPVRNFDSSRIRLTKDSVFNPVSYTLELDTSSKSLTFRTAWQEGTRYNLELDRDFAEDTSGKKLLRSDTLFFNTRLSADYGALSLRVRNIDTTLNPVLLFIQSERVVFSTSVRSGSFNSQRFLPGEYELRILYDKNNNGVWDPGEFFKDKRQPELIQTIERRITIRPNWDNEFEVAL
jgi:hypothetical protein